MSLFLASAGEKNQFKFTYAYKPFGNWQWHLDVSTDHMIDVTSFAIGRFGRSQIWKRAHNNILQLLFHSCSPNIMNQIEEKQGLFG